MDTDQRTPLIELHVHLEGTIPRATVARYKTRNDPPAMSPAELDSVYRFSDVPGFFHAWTTTTNCLRTRRDFADTLRQYAAVASAQGVVYMEATFSPCERMRRGIPIADIFGGYLDGARIAMEESGIVVRLIPDISRGATVEDAAAVARHAIAAGHDGVVGLGLGGREQRFPDLLYVDIFRKARAGGLRVIPHVGEGTGPDAVRRVLDLLRPHRIRHGISAAADPSLMRELRDRGVGLDMCITSNVRCGLVRSPQEHPLPTLIDAGVACSVSTDNPALLGITLRQELDTAVALGVDPLKLQCTAAALAVDDLPRRLIHQHLDRIGPGANARSTPMSYPATMATRFGALRHG